jgi:hypothetical protein
MLNHARIAGILRVSPATASVYVELLTHGGLSRENLQRLTGMAAWEIDMALEELSRFVRTDGDAYRVREERKPPGICRIMRDCEPIGIVQCEGWEGIRHVYREILEEAIKTGGSILALENNASNSEIGDKFVRSYVRRRAKHGIDARVICPDTPEDRKYRDRYEGEFTKIKLLPGLRVEANVNIVGNLVMAFSTNPLQGTLRRNRAEAETWKSVFEMLWESGSKLDRAERF